MTAHNAQMRRSGGSMTRHKLRTPRRSRLPRRSSKLAAILGAILLTGFVVLGLVVAFSPRTTTERAAIPKPPVPSHLNQAKTGSTGRADESKPKQTGTAYPNHANTGYENAPGYPGALTDCSKITIQSDKTYKYCDFPAGLYIGNSDTVLENVTFVGCRFADNAADDADVADYSDKVSFRYDSFEPSTVPMTSEPTSPYTVAIASSDGNEYGIDQRYAGALTIDHSDFWGFADAIQFSYSSQKEPLTITHSWFHNPKNPSETSQAGGGDHTDGILNSYGGASYITITNNSIVGDGNTQAVALQGSRPYDHVWITNNYLSGYGYMICIGGHNEDTNITFTGNLWSSEFEPIWGPLYDDVNFVTANLGNIWRDNRYHVAPGTTWLAQGNNGLYWWPEDAAAIGQDKISTSQIIGHSTDYAGPRK